MSGSIQVRIRLTGQDALVAWFKAAPAQLLSSIKSELVDFMLGLRDQAAAAAAGKTDRLANSITASVVQTSNTVTGSLSTEGVAYAAIQEYGGSIAGHMIYPVRAKVLVFAWAGGEGPNGEGIYASVNWPGATIRPKAYIGNTMKANRAEFAQIIQQAVDKLQSTLP